MRMVAKLVVIAAGGLLLLGLAVPAGAATGPRPYQVLAGAQTRQAVRHLTTSFHQVSSPVSCDQTSTTAGTLLLPVFGGHAGSRTFSCVTTAHTVLVDLGGFACTEDNNPDSTWTTAAGDVLRFSHGNLEAICQDVIRIVTPAPLTVDGQAVQQHVAVSTPEFLSTVHPSTGALWHASGALGHVGTLWSAYGGYKQLLPLAVGHHTVVTDFTPSSGPPAVLTFEIDVQA